MANATNFGYAGKYAVPQWYARVSSECPACGWEVEEYIGCRRGDCQCCGLEYEVLMAVECLRVRDRRPLATRPNQESGGELLRLSGASSRGFELVWDTPDRVLTAEERTVLRALMPDEPQPAVPPDFVVGSGHIPVGALGPSTLGPCSPPIPVFPDSENATDCEDSGVGMYVMAAGIALVLCAMLAYVTGIL